MNLEADDDIDNCEVLPLNADGHQGEGAGVDGRRLHQGDNVAANLTKWKITKTEEDYLKIKICIQHYTSRCLS